ncbi:hypothetical protein [Fuerstiella marisgermanici]|uniref:Type II secretion system protein I n=1 Tax=Fuerstiella marisgermanici TaxID=1891926 RepID=A0A1P8WCA2_9PLAN|nr:hypothetical protein [Fuerstiella marisgermanici]APZ91698.1 type II secretion system protein I [Fuerstiella marisgermanici]
MKAVRRRLAPKRSVAARGCCDLRAASFSQPPDHRQQHVTRSGLTLLEVLVSTAIFLGALTAIMQVMRVGHDSRLSARMDAECALRCESVMAEIVSGIQQPVAVSNQQFDGDADENWVYSVEVGDGGGTSLLLVTVRVQYSTGEDTPISQFQLSRLMRDPQLFLDAAMSAEDTEE